MFDPWDSLCHENLHNDLYPIPKTPQKTVLKRECVLPDYALLSDEAFTDVCQGALWHSNVRNQLGPQTVALLQREH